MMVESNALAAEPGSSTLISEPPRKILKTGVVHVSHRDVEKALDEALGIPLFPVVLNGKKKPLREALFSEHTSFSHISGKIFLIMEAGLVYRPGLSSAIEVGLEFRKGGVHVSYIAIPFMP